MRHEQSFRELEEAVIRALAELDRLRGELDQSQQHAGELETLLGSFRTGDDNPADMKARLNRLEAENRELYERIARGREGVARLLARIRFLEIQQP